MIDDEYSEVLVENQFSFIEVDVVDVTVGLVLGVPLNQVVECRFDLARVVVDNDRVSVDHCLRDGLQPLLAFWLVEHVLGFDPDLRDEPLDCLLLWIQNLACPVRHESQDCIFIRELIFRQTVVVPIRNRVFIRVEFAQGVLVVDFDAQVVQLLEEDLHQIRPLALITDSAVDHHRCSEYAVTVDKLTFLL